jgi:pectate lyase
MNCSAIIRTCLLVATVALVGGCGGNDNPSSNNPSTGGVTAATGGAGGATSAGTTGGSSSSAGNTSATGGSSAATGGSSAATGGSAAATGGSSAATGGSAAATGGGTSVAGATSTGGATGGGTATAPFAYFVSQANGTTTATLSGGVITANSTYGTSGNAFKYVAPNYYGTSANGFIAYPAPLSGDFSIAAEVTITTQNKANNACGVGLGVTTGFNPTDTYAYVLMRNQNNSTNAYYVSGAGAISASGAPNIPFTNGTALQLSFSRTGTNVTFSAGPVGGTPTTQTLAAGALTDGTNVYGTGAVYPAISFNNVAATFSKLIVKDASGATVYDSSTGTLTTYVPASLTLSQAAASVKMGASTSVTATAVAVGGTFANVTAVAADPTVVGVTVTGGATNSTILLNGLKGGVTTVTVTNTGDTNTATNTKTLTVSVNDFPTSDAYGSLATSAYPVPGAASAFADGELSLTFDAVPTLNTGGSIKIYKLADGTEVDSISFSGESQVFGTSASPTTIAVGSQLARVSGNTLYFAPHIGKLAYATAYYVVIPTASITGTLNGAQFNGLSDLMSVATWNFTTQAAPTLNATNITVDGSQTSQANFRTIQAALSAIGTSLSTAPTVNINVAAGTYNELLRYTGTGLGTGQTVRISGPPGNNQGDTCIVQWINGNAMNGTTATRATFYFSGANLIVENITLKNNGVRSVVNQAETLYFANGASGTTLAAYNSSFFSNQDTLQTSGRNWFYKCHIEGNVDFIWGTADAALFEGCDLQVVNDGSSSSSYGIFVARTGATIAASANGTVGKGYVLYNSTVSVDANVAAYFGRDAGGSGFYDQAALVNVTFTGAGTIASGLWNIGTAPVSLGDSSYVGWKSAGCSGLNLASLTTATGTSATITGQSAEYDTRDHILNRVVTVTNGAPAGYQAATTSWDVSSLATAWGAP